MTRVAVMRDHGLTTIISADAHFGRFEEITRLDPQLLWADDHRKGTL